MFGRTGGSGFKWFQAVRFMRMLASAIHLELLEHRSTHSGLGKHSSDCCFDCSFGELLEFLTKCPRLETTWISRVTHQHSLVGFSSSDDNAFCIGDDDVVAGVDMRCVFGAMLAHEDSGDLDSHAAQDLTVSVNMTPTSLDVTILGKGSLTRHGINDLETVALTLLQGFSSSPWYTYGHTGRTHQGPSDESTRIPLPGLMSRSGTSGMGQI